MEVVGEVPNGRIERLIAASARGKPEIASPLIWPESLPIETKWISDELLTVHGTEFVQQLPVDVLNRLRKWESINFYAQNVHGERSLTRDLVTRIYTSEYLSSSPYLFHFIAEENEHMAMFAEFCMRYGTLLPSLRIDLGHREEPVVEEFLLFCRTILFEFYVDYYNRVAAHDDSLPDIVVTINKRHHLEEARHIGFSKEMIQRFFRAVVDAYPVKRVDELRRYVEEYMINQIELVYSTRVYELAGIDAPADFRRSLLQHPARRRMHLEWLRQPFAFFESIGLLGARSVEEIVDGYFLPQTEALMASASPNPKLTIRTWLQTRVAPDVTITDDFDVLESGVVDSLAFMRYLVVIEQAVGREMRLEEIDLDDIRTMNSIERAFLRNASERTTEEYQ